MGVCNQLDDFIVDVDADGDDDDILLIFIFSLFNLLFSINISSNCCNNKSMD
jgi:hypothetical protein